MNETGTPENLKPFKEGESGNPAGRPKGSRNRSTIARELLSAAIKMPEGKSKEFCEKLGLKTEGDAESLLTAVQIARGIITGDTKHYTALMDSGYGQPKQNIELDIPLKPIEQINFVQSESIEHPETHPELSNGKGNHS